MKIRRKPQDNTYYPVCPTQHYDLAELPLHNAHGTTALPGCLAYPHRLMQRRLRQPLPSAFPRKEAQDPHQQKTRCPMSAAQLMNPEPRTPARPTPAGTSAWLVRPAPRTAALPAPIFLLDCMSHSQHSHLAERCHA